MVVHYIFITICAAATAAECEDFMDISMDFSNFKDVIETALEKSKSISLELQPALNNCHDDLQKNGRVSQENIKTFAKACVELIKTDLKIVYGNTIIGRIINEVEIGTKIWRDGKELQQSIINHNNDQTVTSASNLIKDLLSKYPFVGPIIGPLIGDAVEIYLNSVKKEAESIEEMSDLIDIYLNGGSIANNTEIIYNELSNKSILGSKGNDTVYNEGSNLFIEGNIGKDVIVNAGNNVTIKVDGEKNEIYNEGSEVNIIGSIKVDKIINNGSSVTINAEDGADLIYNTGSYSNINGGAGNDSILNSSSNATIIGGKGNDNIRCYNDEVINYTNGDGNDTIFDFSENSTINISEAPFTTMVNGNNVIITVGEGSIKLLNAKDKTINIINNFDNDTQQGGEDDTNSSGNDTTSSGNDTTPSGNDTTSGGNDTTSGGVSDTQSGGVETIPADKDDTLTGSQGGSSPTSTKTDSLNYNELTKKIKTHNAVTLGSGWSGTLSNSDYESTVKNINASKTSGALYIVGNSNANVIQGGSGNNTLVGGIGKDTLTGGSGKNVFLYSNGDGKDIITDYTAGEDIVKISSGSITKAAISKNNVVFTIDKGSITLQDAKNKKITVTDSNGNTSTQLYGSKSLSIADGDGQTLNTSLNTTAVTLNSTARTTNFNLVGNSNANVIQLGTGNTTLTTGKGKDTIEYNGGDVKISDYTPLQDKIKLNNTNILEASLDGSEAILTTNKGTLRVSNANKQITFINGKSAVNYFIKNNTTIEGSNAADTITGGSENDLMTGGKGADVFIYSGGNDTISDYNPAQKDVIQLSGVTFDTYSISGKNAILSFKNSDETLTIVNGKDKIVTLDKSAKLLNNIREKIFTKNNSESSYIADNDVVTINAASNTKAISITGNANDNLIKGSAKNDTISSGAGNDSIVAGKGKDTIIFSSGNDTIKDYAAGQDIIKFNDSITSASASGKDVIFTTNEGSIRLQNISTKKITIIDNNNNKQNLQVGSQITISGNNGNDTLIGGSSGGIFTAGKGNDVINLASTHSKATIIYTAGSDKITNFDLSDTLKLAKGVTATASKKSSTEYTLTLKKGKNTLGTLNISGNSSFATDSTTSTEINNKKKISTTVTNYHVNIGGVAAIYDSKTETISTIGKAAYEERDIFADDVMINNSEMDSIIKFDDNSLGEVSINYENNTLQDKKISPLSYSSTMKK